MEEKRGSNAIGHLSNSMALTLFNKPNNLPGLILTYGCPASVNQGDFLQ